MRLPALVVIATVGITAGQVPVIQTQPATQPPRDAITGQIVFEPGPPTGNLGTPVRCACLRLSPA